MATLELPRRPLLALLDRDGTIVDETEYLVDQKRVALLPGAADAIARLARAGVRVAVVTNQSAIARGWLTEDGLLRVTKRIEDLLAVEGARIDLWLHCGHHPELSPPNEREAARRKPAPGMLLEALAHFHVAPQDAVTIGDSDRDLEAGERARVPGILVRTGKGEDELTKARARLGHEPLVVADLSAAVDLLLSQAK